MNINQPIHFIGIGGTGMNPLALLLASRGISVQGSDIASSTTTDLLKSHGINVFVGHDSANLGNSATVVYSTAITDDNPELVEAKSKGLEILHRSDILKYLSEGKKSIFIAGSHGKTSTTGLITHLFNEAGLAPSAVVGGKMLNYGTYHLEGNGDYFIAEADESDGSFLKYSPFISVITNIDYDHLDHYGSFENLKEAFKEFGRATDEEGIKVYGWDSEPIRDIARDTGDFIGYGSLIGCHNRILKTTQKKSHTYFKCVIDKEIAEFEMNLLGKHNVQNAMAAISVATDMGISLDAIRKGLKSFKGMGRRLEIAHDSKEFTVINDYAHNPGKIFSAIEAVRSAYPDSNLISVFQPHRYSRLKTMYDMFASSFSNCDSVIVTPIYAAGEKPVENINHEKLSRDISHLSSVKANPVHHLNEVYEALNVKDFAHNVILLLGAGDITLACDLIVERISCLENS